VCSQSVFFEVFIYLKFFANSTCFEGDDALEARKLRRVQSELSETRHDLLQRLDLGDDFV